MKEVCCSVLQRVAACCSVLQRVAACRIELQVDAAHQLMSRSVTMKLKRR